MAPSWMFDGAAEKAAAAREFDDVKPEMGTPTMQRVSTTTSITVFSADRGSFKDGDHAA